MKTKEFALPNDLPLYKLMYYKVTNEQCRIIKVNPAITETDIESKTFGTILVPLTVNIKIIRNALGLPYVVMLENISPYDLIVWNESMSPTRKVTFRTRKGITRTVQYN